MGSINRRIEQLERMLAEDYESPPLIDEVHRKFIDYLTAAKREGFEPVLTGRSSPMELAAHLVWLAVDEDPREAEVREALEDMFDERGVDEDSAGAGGLWKLVNGYTEAIRDSRQADPA